MASRGVKRLAEPEEAQSDADFWKDLFIAAQARFLHANQQQAQQQAHEKSLKLSLSLAQKALRVCQQKLNLSRNASKRAEKAEQDKEVLSAKMGEIGDLVEGFPEAVMKDSGETRVGGFKGVIQTLHAVRGLNRTLTRKR